MAERDKKYRVLHDLRGPLVNVRGFANELETAAASLAGLIDQYQQQLPAEFHAAVSTLVREDFDPCLDYLNRSIKKLDDRIDNFATQMMSESAE